MSSSISPYTAVQPAKIGAGIVALYDGLRRDGKTYTRSASANVIVLSSGPAQGGAADSLIETLSLVRPGRFFLVVPDSKAASVSAEISARVVPVSKTENVCSDVIRITAPESLTDAVAEILRAQFLSGMVLELCLFDPKVPQSLIEKIYPLVDSVLYDSAVYDARPEVLRWISETSTQNVDAQWLLLGPWRDEIRRVFDRPASCEALSQLKGIYIEHVGPDPDAVPACAFLMAGWLGDRMGLRLKGGASSPVLSGPGGKDVGLVFSRRGVAGDASLAAIRLQLGDRGEVVLSREGLTIAAEVKVEPPYRAVRPLEDDSRDSALRRHFLIGESIANYPAAFRLGLSLRSSRKAA